MKSKKYEPFILFILGFVLFMFTRLSRIVPTIPCTMLIAPVCILRFIRTQRAGRGILLTLAGYIIFMNLALWGLFDVSGDIATVVFNLVRSTLLAIIYFLPYMADRLLYPKFKKYGALSSLIFPVAVTAIIFFMTLEGPFEGSGQMGKYLFGPTAFKQYISILGLPFAVFMVSWFASMTNYVWENMRELAVAKRPVIIYAVLVAVIIVFGSIKSNCGVRPETVKTAAIVLIPEDGKGVSLQPVLEKRIAHPYDQRFGLLKEKIITAASNGAKIIMSHEFVILLKESDRERFIDECRKLASEQGVYLAINYAYFADKGKGQNILVFIDDKGTVRFEHAKKYLLGFGELGEYAVFKKGPEVLQFADTPYGRITTCICREIDMAWYIVQAGRNNVDIMLSPSYEWPVSSQINFGYMRGIENGFSLVRAAYSGLSFASDYHGRILTTMPFDKQSSGIMYAEVPIKGIKTLYPLIGEAFGWVCVFFILILVILSVAVKIRKRIIK